MAGSMTASSRTIHDEIMLLCEKVNKKKFYFRNPAKCSRPIPALEHRGRLSIYRDQIVCALANKAANTARAIVVLCDSALADDAYALCRVLLENAVSLAWMVQQDWRSRIDTFALSINPSHRHLVEVIEQVYAGSDLAEEAKQYEHQEESEVLSAQAFNHQWMKWAWFPDESKPGKLRLIELKQMFADLEQNATAARKDNVLYRLAYFDSSLYVHSAPRSLRHILRELADEDWHALRVRPRSELASGAIAFSNIFMLMVLTAIDNFLKAGISDEIAELLEKCRSEVEE